MHDQSSKPLTHALPGLYPGRARTLHLTLCGSTGITNDQHTDEPTCPRCLERLQEAAADDAQIWTDLGYVADARGVMVPGPNAKGGPF